jgi:hypothetical protein
MEGFVVKYVLVADVDLLSCLSCLHYQNSDFGLATEMKDSKKVVDELYKLTGMTGSARYMAPGE